LRAIRLLDTHRIRRVDPVAEAASNTLGFLADVPKRSWFNAGNRVNVHVPRRGTGPTVWLPQSAFPVGADVRKGTASTVFVAREASVLRGRYGKLDRRRSGRDRLRSPMVNQVITFTSRKPEGG